ncbi:MAG: isocitrate/isopropylmalate family dehydrogenase, partial [Ignavibacteria bacterium]|nr:isocitrate/isopropylmalate family dehydrogenase [Ignavibacteria bacterium]
IVIPIAIFMSAVLMLEHLGEIEIANKIKSAISAVILEGKVQSYDMMKLRGSAEVFSKGAASTQQITDAVIGKLDT